MKPLELAPEASAELLEAAAWYERRQRGLAARLMAEFESTAARMCEMPGSFPRLLDVPEDLVIRRALLTRFPFGAVFMELPSSIRVIAFAHAKRRPNYWLDRVM